MKKLINRENYPIYLKYNNETLIISPRQIIEYVDESLIEEELPKELTLADM